LNPAEGGFLAASGAFDPQIFRLPQAQFLRTTGSDH
jgi:hypothetical protein